MKHINKETLRVVGNAGYRIGKDIIREGTKVVVMKSVGAAIGGLITDKMDGVRNLTLDDVLGDITRQNKKAQKKAIKMLRKQGVSKEDAFEIVNDERIKESLNEAKDIEVVRKVSVKEYPKEEKIKESLKDFKNDEKKVTE